MTTITYAVRRTNPKSVWPYRIVRIVTEAGHVTRTHKLVVKFRTAEAAKAALDKAQFDNVA